ncbi:hypothetical protein HG537_0C01820 [Torulaspora globosa]|uniref:tRNA dimethylallyltransferase n=1 Tax=Torulaspora globosa TaxID=48254 RepID=A0A7H9HT18_9SACH|nr:hypothetical protein HG537_0C01820 [Torulaspora sp. CBS 2947]
MLRTVWRSRVIMGSRGKVIVVAGTTGVGKSQLSIQLAERFNGEVINSDSMQVYKGIPVITNKHPVQERNGIEHHVMNHVDWSEEYFLHRFERECDQAISDIHSRGKVAVIVGGTHYYLQCLFNKRIDDVSREVSESERRILDSEDPQLLYDTLKECDPRIACKYHPNDARRIRRMLEIFYKTGKKPSDAYAEQQVGLRYDTLFFWLYSDPEPLNKRLDDRVDKMLDEGAMSEINELYDYYKSKNYDVAQCENGVWQVIGFKEFLPWLEKQPNITFEDCVDRMKIRTRQYAKKQVKWIKKMLIPDINGDIYLLDASDLSNWDVNVAERSKSITENFISGEPVSQKRAPDGLAALLDHKSESRTSMNDTQQFTCDKCFDRNGKPLVAVGQDNWEIHIRSRRHRSNLTRGTRKAAYEKWKQTREKPVQGD